MKSFCGSTLPSMYANRESRTTVDVAFVDSSSSLIVIVALLFVAVILELVCPAAYITVFGVFVRLSANIHTRAARDKTIISRNLVFIDGFKKIFLLRLVVHSPNALMWPE